MKSAAPAQCRIGIFYPADPIGHIPGGIDTVVRSILEHAPPDLAYTLFGATTNAQLRPPGCEIPIANGRAHFVPLVSADATAVRRMLPLSIRYMLQLRHYLHAGRLRSFDIFDFHRIEPVAIFARDPRPKNVMIHQDMAILRNKHCDIGWRHAPWLYERLERALFPCVEQIICVRESAVERYRKTYPAIADRFLFLPTWVDAEVFRPAKDTEERVAVRQRISAQHGLPASGRILVFVGRLDRQKDPLLLMDALGIAINAQPDIRVLIVGDGILRTPVEARIRALDLDEHIRMLGVCEPEAVAEVLRAADLFVLSSAYEGMPIAVLESLASGTPVVTTNVGEVARVVTDGLNGAIVTHRTPQALADGILSALRNLESLRGTPCQRAVVPYSPEHVLSRIYENHRSQAARKALTTFAT